MARPKSRGYSDDLAKSGPPVLSCRKAGDYQIVLRIRGTRRATEDLRQHCILFVSRCTRTFPFTIVFVTILTSLFFSAKRFLASWENLEYSSFNQGLGRKAILSLLQNGSIFSSPAKNPEPKTMTRGIWKVSECGRPT